LAYVAAVRDLNRAVQAWDRVSLNIDPRSPTVAQPWTREQLAATVAVATAWQTLISRRRAYDSTTRRRRPGSGPPR
jgi:hypothetical protein